MELAKRKPDVVAETTGSGIRAAETRGAKARDDKKRPTRRTFTAEYRLRMVTESDAALASGEVGAVGRCFGEGLYSSHLTTWRKQRDAGELAAFSKKRGPKPSHNPLTEEVARLEREKARLEERLRKAEIVIDVQEKSRVGIHQSHSRPYVSDDNPFSEAAFRKRYRPMMPERFGSLEDAHATSRELFDWYNERHYHSSIALVTPADLHHGRAPRIIAARQRVLEGAYQDHPERFVRGAPVHPNPPSTVWINPPATAFEVTAH